VADLNRERGQILLIAAFTLAVTFIALAMVVNGAIFTENLASQGESRGGTDALEVRAEANATAGTVMDHVNEHAPDDTVLLQQAFIANVSRMGEQFQRYELLTGTSLDLSYIGDKTDGVYVEDEAPPTNDFVAADGTQDWIVGSDISRTRALEFTVREAPVSVTDSAVFRVRVTDASDTYELRIGESSGHPAVRVESPAAAGPMECVLSGQSYPLELDVMGAQFGGEYCEALDEISFSEGVLSNYQFMLVNGHNARGNYSMVLTGGPVSLGGPYGSAGTDEPIEKFALYDAEVAMLLRTDRITYEDEIRVAPGEQQ